MIRARVLAVVIAAHVLVLMALHGAARAETPECACVSCDLDGSKTPNATVADYARFATAFGSDLASARTRERYDPRADFDRSSTVTSADWAVFVGCCPLGQPRR